MARNTTSCRYIHLKQPLDSVRPPLNHHFVAIRPSLRNYNFFGSRPRLSVPDFDFSPFLQSFLQNWATAFPRAHSEDIFGRIIERFCVFWRFTAKPPINGSIFGPYLFQKTACVILFYLLFLAEFCCLYLNLNVFHKLSAKIVPAPFTAHIMEIFLGG